MVGLERTVVPLLASQEFGLLSSSVALSFLVSFGIVKAGANLAAGQLSDRVGRRRILVAGWVAGLPVAPLIIWAPDWRWIVAANVLLGINQGLCWSTTVIMKIDLVGPRQRGLAMGLNEFAGYLAVSLASLATGYLAARFGLRPVPFYPGIALAVAGLLASLLLVRETTPHSRIEGAQRAAAGGDRAKSLAQVFALTTWKNPTLFASSQAGMVNNLNDAVVWGLVPIVLARAGLPVGQIGVVAATYPAVWGIAQLATGALSDRWGRKWMIAAGMWVQALGIMLFATASGLRPWLLGSVLLGLGTALVYPTLLAAVSDVAQPEWRATSIGVYRLWRDSGYAVGGLLAGILADRFGSGTTIAVVALLTALSGLVVAAAMYETLQKDAHPPLRREEIPS
ncbi:MAG: MFS transporter [Gemmatimonadetes bacterium]|nr:MFS transporter [Gemmatimonadota bacterium]